MKKKSIRTKVSRLMIVIALVSLTASGITAMGGLSFLRLNTERIYSELGNMALTDSANALLSIAREDTLKLAKQKAALITSRFNMVQSMTAVLAQSATDIQNNPEYYNPHPISENGTPRIIWAKNALRSDLQYEAELMGNIQVELMGIMKAGDHLSAAYVGTESGYYITTSGTGTSADDYDPRTRPWYIAAKEEGNPVWTDVYEDAYGKGLMITCAVPYYDKDGNFAGVAGIDSLLTDLSEIVNGERSWESETTFILNAQGETVVPGTIPEAAPWNDLYKFLSENSNPNITNLADEISAGMSGAAIIGFSGKADSKEVLLNIAYAPCETLPWRLVTLINNDEISAPASIMMESISELTQNSLQSMDALIIGVVLSFVGILILILISTVLLSRRFARSLTNPIIELQSCVRQIADGRLDYRLNIRTEDEIERLSVSINKMTSDLKNYIDNLTKVTAEKERIGAELEVAAKIQAGMLPCIFPPYPDRDEFIIFATMLPAKEVGGDFYDFFLIDHNHLAVVMADVSGKGVPAALFMVIARTLIKNNAQHGRSPKDVFEFVNNLLCENNDAGMFVTAFMGYLDIPSGDFTFVNAGHNPPLLRSGERFDRLKAKPGFVLAGMENMLYKQSTITLKPGDELFLYTDGITEAANNDNKLFGEPLLLETVNKYAGLSLNEFTASIKRDIDKFAEGAEQTDDITMLTLRYKGKLNGFEESRV